MQREHQTVAYMINIYCNDKHDSETRCDECQELLDYATIRLQRCQFQEEKPTCANCPVHCYRRSMKSRIIDVMRHAGPKMIYKHPILAIKHLRDKKLKLK